MNNRITRVVLIQNHLGELGGVSTFCASIAAGFTSRGYEVEIGGVSPPVLSQLSLYDDIPNTWNLVEGLAPHEALKASPVPRLFSASRLKRLQDQFTQKVTEAAHQKFLSYGPETVVIFTQLYARELCEGAVNFDARQHRFSLVCQYHNSFAGGQVTNDVRRVLSSYADADKFLSLTEADAVLFQKAGMNNSGYILNPLPVAVQEPAPRTSNIVISLGRYNRQKSLDHMIRAWSLLGELTHSWELHLYGDGPERSFLQTMIDELQVSHSVFLKGATAHPTSVLSGAAFTVQSSQYEGLPLALLEASLSAVPSVAYNCAPGIAEVFEDGQAGLLVAPNDVGDLAASMKTLMSDSDERIRIGDRAYVWAQENFATSKILDDWEALFEELSL